MDACETWRAYGRHAAIILRAGPAPFTRHEDHAFVVLSGSPHVDTNQAALFGDATAADAAMVVEAATARDVPCLLAISGSLATRAAVTAVVAAGGFLRSPAPEAAFRAERLPAVGGGAFTVRRVEGHADHAAIRRIFVLAHGYEDEPTLAMVGPRLLDGPGVEGWLAWDGDVPVAAVFLTQHDGSIGVFDMLTVPEHRRRGAATALLSRSLADVGARTGARTVLFWSTPIGRPLYESLGFEQVDDVEAWTLGASDEDLASVGAGKA